MAVIKKDICLVYTLEFLCEPPGRFNHSVLKLIMANSDMEEETVIFSSYSVAGGDPGRPDGQVRTHGAGDQQLCVQEDGCEGSYA